MGQVLFASEQMAPPPGHGSVLVMQLSCDGNHGLLPQTTGEYRGTDYMAMRQAAHEDGWRRRNGHWYSSTCCKIPKGGENEE